VLDEPEERVDGHGDERRPVVEQAGLAVLGERGVPAVVDAAVVRIAVPTSSGRFAGRVSHPASPATYRISPNATATLAAKTPTAMNAAMRASRGPPQ